MYRHIIIKLSNYLYILVFTRMNLSFQQCESLLHSFFAENTLTEIAYLVVPAGWFFPAAATWFFFSFFSKMGVCLTFFVGSGVSWRLTYNGVRLNLYSKYWSTSATGATRFPAVTLAAFVLIPPLPHPWGNKGRNQCCLLPVITICSKGSGISYSTCLRCDVRGPYWNLWNYGNNSDIVPLHTDFN